MGGIDKRYDYREKGDKPKIAKKLGFKEAVLDVGDYEIGDLVVEVKAKDFLTSYFNNNIYQQLYRLFTYCKDNNKFPMLMIPLTLLALLDYIPSLRSKLVSKFTNFAKFVYWLCYATLVENTENLSRE